MYIKVTNNGSIKPEALELLGYSTKRNQASTIGEKGTGLKFSLIQACRDGIDFAVATDSFICTASTEKVDLENKRIVLNYQIKGNKTIKKVKTSFTVHAGHTEWTDDWFILREVLQNAIDTELELELNRFGVDESVGDLAPQFLSSSETIDYAEKGKTSVYIRRTGRLFSVIQNLDSYFVTKHIEENIYGKVLPKKDTKLRIFKKGILIQEYDKKSLFDYSLIDLKLTEARQVASDWDLTYYAGWALNKASLNVKKQVINAIIADEKVWEGSPAFVFKEESSWRQAFESVYSDSILIANESYEHSNIVKQIEEAGKTVLIVKNYNLYSSLEALGIPTVKNWKIAKKEYNFIPFYFPDAKKEKVQKILDFFGYSKQIRFYDDIVDEAGFYNQVEDYIALSVSTVLSSDLESILVHELIHWKYKVDDETRAYQDICTDLIASLI